jgi:putative transcriptional regulator
MKNDTWFEKIPAPHERRPHLVAMTPEERVALSLKRWRQYHHVSQQELASKAGTTQRVVSLLETGKYNPSLELLKRLATAMEARLDVAFWPQAR